MKTFMSELEEHQSMIDRLANCTGLIEAAGELLITTLKQDGNILLCGNGGSAADGQHIAAEFVARYEKKRKAMAAIALTTDSSILTAHANDFDLETVFSRQVEAIGNDKDFLIAISTSGKSRNVLRAIEAAKSKGMIVIGLAGCEAGDLSKKATVCIIVPSAVTARIQEVHILFGHWWCSAVGEALSVSNYP